MVKDPDFYDDFSTYNTDNSAFGSTNQVSHYRNNGVAETVATNSSGSWELSKLWSGTSASSSYPGYAYIDGDANRLMFGCVYPYPTCVNFDLSNKRLISVDSISAQMTQRSSYDQRAGIRFMVSEDEKSYYELSIMGVSGGDRKIPGSTGSFPAFVKVENGSIVEGSLAVPTSWTAYNNTGEVFLSYDVSINGNVITYTISRTTGQTWTGSYTDSSLSSMLSEMAYPMTLVNVNGASGFDNIEMYYTEKEPVCVDNEDGTLTITAYPSDYIENMAGESSSIAVITAFYSSEKELLESNVKLITDLANPTQFIVSKNQTSGSFGKIFIWDGNISLCLPLAEYVDIE